MQSRSYDCLHIDIDECVELTHNCVGVAMCMNEVPSFRCTCPTGYALDANDTSCDGKLYCIPHK